MPFGVIIVAGGRGQRLGGPVPKQLLDLGGRSILQRSVRAFDRHPGTDAIVVVLPADLVGAGPTIVGETGRPCHYVAGGARRQDSVRLGLAALPSALELVLIHDAARPFVDGALIARVIDATARTGAAVPATPARDTVKRVLRDGRLVIETVPRDEVWLAQTPQGFRRSILEEAVALGASGVDATDEATLVERAGHAVEVVPGDERNMKITTADDLLAARASFPPVPRVGTGYDLHRLESDRPLVFASVVVPFDRGPMGHSDGDVVCHALTDAVLGAAAAGDIGQHFPNTDPRWKDAAGLDLLGRAVAIVAQLGWRPVSADVTVLLERPRLVPYLSTVRERIATVLGVDVGQVSVKAKTNEGVDAVGRGEAVAAHAVAVLVPGGAA
jgi:2-C-methyl-D-erythritol 4-phosphate cytidylyltransferase / 2-C-methyl-D-erythritol 2,4-cyclodiphosphate synthase